jgi:arylsulfatase A-like enzyme
VRKAPAPAAEAPPLPVFLGAGLLYGALLFAVCGFRLAPRPPTASAYLVLAFLGLFLGLAHGALTALVTTLLGRLTPARRWPRLFDAAVALALGLFYSGLGISLFKLAITGSHLRFEDLWFVFGSLRQLGDEGSAQERAMLYSAVLLPVGLAVVLFATLRIARGRRTTPPVSAPAAPLAALAGVAVAALLVLCWRYPYARSTAGTRAPEVTWMARQLTGGAALGGWTGSAPQRAFAPDPARHGTIGDWSAPERFRRDNVVFIMLESVPWSRLFGPDARPGAAPRLTALAAESTVFARAYATATHSDYAQTSILASLHPRKFERHDYFIDLAYPRTLIWDLFEPSGYRTALFSCQNEGWGNMKAFLQTPGLRLFRHSPDWPQVPRRGEGAESKVFEPTPVNAFAEWLRRAPEEPFLAYLNFQATHYPYVVPPGTPELFTPATIDFRTTFLSYPLDRIPVMENRFYNALHEVDRAVGEVVDALEAAGVWDETVLVVVSDHGEAFYEHGVPTHGTMLLEEQLRTAALLRLPGAPARVIQEPVSVLDLVPSVLHFLELPPHGNFQGRSDILDPAYSATGRPFLFTIQGMTQEDAILLDGWKLVLNRDRRERALFDLTSDPGERTNLAATRPDKVAELERHLSALLLDQLAYYREQGWQRGWYPPKLP